MTTKILTGTYSAGYHLQSPITTLSIAASGYVEGNGIYTSKTATAAYSVINDGRVVATGSYQTPKFGVDLYHGGSVINGGNADTKALIQGYQGVSVSAGLGTVQNFGTIDGVGIKPQFFGVYLHAGGTVTNGSATDTTAVIHGGGNGIVIGSFKGPTLPATVTNFGTINCDLTYAEVGVIIIGSTVGGFTNGAVGDATALVQGYAGIGVSSTTTIVNLGTIQGIGGAALSYGVNIGGAGTGGSLTNGAANQAAALIAGYNGVVIFGQTSAVNLGTIQGTGAQGAGVDVGTYKSGTIVGTGGSLTNGAAGDTGAIVEGFIGVSVEAVRFETVTNFGTISGTGGTAVQFNSSLDVLDVEAGSTFVGSVVGGGGTLVLASGVGTLTGDLAGGTVTVSGSMAPTAFGGFGTVEVAAGARFTVAGAVAIAAGQSLVDAGSLTMGGAIANAGTIALAAGGPAAGLVFSASATLSGGGTVTLGTGLSNKIYGASASTVLTNVDNTISGSGFVGLRRLSLVNQAKGVIEATGGGIVLNTQGHAVSNAGLMEAAGGGRLVLQSTVIDDSGGGVLMAASGSTVDLQNATIAGGTLQSSGSGRFATFFVANLIDGTTAAVTSQATVSVSDGTALTAQGQVVNQGRVLVSATGHLTHLTVGAAGLTLSGGGTVSLSNNALNDFSGVTAAATLTNLDNTIAGAGQLGDRSMILVNQAKGTIDATGSMALIINTGAATIANAGTIEAVGTGGATIVSAVNNTGVLEAAGGVLTVEGAVSGTGSAAITAGTADFASTFTQNVTFTGKSGGLELARSQTYAGSISGFSKTGGTSLDLRDIAFKSAGEATFAGTATSGTLTVTDGTHTAHITLIGDYLGSTFTASSDGHGGTIVVDPAAAAAPATKPPSVHPIVAAMAGLGAGGASLEHRAGYGFHAVPTLIGPRVSVA